jgi:hypothetical protein
VTLALTAPACSLKTGATLTGQVSADNAVYVYLSDDPSKLGKLIASGDNWRTTLDLKPTKLAGGRTYYLHVEAINYGDQGALIGAFHLSGAAFHFANGARTLITDTAGWSGGFNDGNADVKPQPWVAPAGPVFSQGANGVGTWGVVAGVPATAQWIWPSDHQSAPDGPTGACGSCTVDFSATLSPTQAAAP